MQLNRSPHYDTYRLALQSAIVAAHFEIGAKKIAFHLKTGTKSGITNMAAPVNKINYPVLIQKTPRGTFLTEGAPRVRFCRFGLHFREKLCIIISGKREREVLPWDSGKGQSLYSTPAWAV